MSGRSILLARCPQCGKSSIFDGLLTYKAACPACGLQVDTSDVGDASVYPVMLIVSCIVGAIGVWLEFSFAPSLWGHAVVLIPLILVLSILCLRISRAAFLWVQYREMLSQQEHEEEVS